MNFFNIFCSQLNYMAYDFVYDLHCTVTLANAVHGYRMSAL